MEKEFRFSGTIRFEEYLEGIKTVSAKRRFWIQALFFVLGVVFIAAAWAERATSLFIPLLLIGSLYAIYPVTLYRVKFRRQVKKNWDRHPAIKEAQNFVVNPEGLHCSDASGNRSETKWTAFYQLGETPSLFMLYLSPLSPLVLPKRFLPKGELEAFREFVQEQMARAEKK